MNAHGFYYCPSCSKKGVQLRLRALGEDHFGCRYCDWAAFTDSDMAMDLRAISQLELANPGLVYLSETQRQRILSESE